MQVIAITGTPGSGKSTLALALNKRIKGSVLIDVNKLVKEKKLYSGRDKYGTLIVKLGALQRELNVLVKKFVKTGHTVIIEGHLISDIRIRGAYVIVLRAHLKVLLERLKARKYNVEKIRENIAAEALDYCGTSAAKNYQDVYEILPTSKVDALKQALRIIKNRPQGAKKQIQLIYELPEIIKTDRKLAI
ncbi:MAG: AAA family ATPase [Candidatus Micrarchaeia archaeon]